MKYLLIITLTLLSTSLFSQAVVSQEYHNYQFDNDGNVTSEILVYVVKYEGKVVGRFFPQKGKEAETMARAENFALRYKPTSMEELDFVTRKPEDNNGNGKG